jgi:hypothetical protein
VLFFFGQIWVKAIRLYQNTTNLLLFFDNRNLKTRITNSLQCFQVVLQYAISVDKKYEKMEHVFQENAKVGHINSLKQLELPKINIEEAMTFHNGE